MSVTHSTPADNTFSPTGETAWEAAHTVPDNELLAAKLSASATDVLFGRSSAGAGAGEEIALTAAGRAILDDATAAAQRTTLGLGTIVTQDANNVALTGGSITGVTGVGYSVQSFAGVTNPADGATLYQGATPVAPVTTEGIYKLRFPIAGTIIAVALDVGVGAVLGTTEQATVNFRLNATTDTALTTTQQFNAANQGSVITGLTIAIAAGDTAQIKVVYPTFVTNPTGVVISATIFVRT